jgi:hypothetical protein
MKRLLRYPVHTVLRYSLLIILLLWILHNYGVFRRYTIEDVTQVLYEAGLLPTRHFSMVEDHEDSDVIGRIVKALLEGPRIETYHFTIEGPHLSRAYSAEIKIFPSQWLRKRIQQRYAETDEALEMPRDVFVKGNVMLVVDPALPEAEAEKYRRAFESLGLGFFF